MNKLIFCLISLLHLTIFSQELIFPCFDDHINPYIGIISEMYERADREIQYRDVPSARALHYSSTGHYDGEVIRIAGMETQYPSLIPIPIPVDTIIVSAYGLAESSEEIESVVVIRGRQFIEAATGGFPTVIEVDTVEQMITMVVNGRVDAAVEASRAIQPSIGLMGLTEAMVIKSEPLYIINIHHYLHEKNAHLIPELTTILQEMKDSGRIDELLQGY